MAVNNSQITIAIIGFGVIGPRHADTVLKNADTKLVAVVDPSPKTQSEAEKYNAKYFTSIEDLLNSPYKPTAAIICSPNHVHASAARTLATAGVHILIEKPLCSDIPTGKALLGFLKEKEAESGVKALVGHHRRFNPYTVATASALRSGSLGRVIGVNGLWTQRKHEAYFEPEWRRQETAGTILINLIHDVDLLHHFFGPIERVQTEKSIAQRGFDADEGAAVVLRFVNGVVGTFFICDNVPSPYAFEAGTGEDSLIAKSGQDCYRIFGSEASLSVPDMTRWSYDGRPAKNWHHEIGSEKIEVTQGTPFQLQLAHFVKVVRGEEKPNCTVQAGLASLIVCDAVRQSLKTGNAVVLEPYGL